VVVADNVEPMMSSETSFPADDDSRQRLSELVDGEADALGVQRLCRVWSDDVQMRERWHAYHLIGDVLRSEDLAHPGTRDEQFLVGLRNRLAAEPAVLATTPRLDTDPARQRRWLPAMAVAAGFVVAAGVLVVMRVAAPLGSDAVSPVAMAGPGAPGKSIAALAGSQPETMADVQALVADGQLIRDARLERYLAAHKQYGGISAVTVPGVVLRSSATMAPER
jgi:sigma-E factor negative regulatory protein RseA